MKKIRNKITISITLLIILLISILIFFFNNLLKDTHLDIIKREMDEKIEFIDLVFNNNPGLYTGKINSRFSGMVKNISLIIKLRITVVDYDGKVIADSFYDPRLMDNHRYRIEINDSIDKITGESIRYSNTQNIDMLYFSHSLDRYIIRLAKPLDEIERTLNRFRKFIFIAGFLAIIIAIIMTIIISRKITNPIRETRDFAEDFSMGNFSRRILNFSNDEIGILQKALNRMADQTVDEMNKLILEQNKLQITIESINDGIAVIDKNKTILIANKAFISFLDIDAQVINRIYYEVIRGSSFNSKIEQSLLNNKSSHFQEKFYTDIICDVFIIPIREEKSMQGILIVLHNITEKKKLDQLKTDLIGNLSHELKTPITILRGYLETLDDNLHDTAMCSDFISKAIANIDRQDSIINDMLKLNMMETMNDVTVENINLKEIIISCIEILGNKFKSKNITIDYDINSLDRGITGNKFLAEEIIFNIILNAINYTNPEGAIRIAAEQRGDRLAVSISDSGIGIPEESIGRIFERFYRVDKSRSRATGGTGLGLSIVKHAAELLNWEVNVSSNSNGTTFIIGIH